jgi:hypothetical protein
MVARQDLGGDEADCTEGANRVSPAKQSVHPTRKSFFESQEIDLIQKALTGLKF